MEHYAIVTMELQDQINESVFEAFPNSMIMETDQKSTAYVIPLERNLSEDEADSFANKVADYMFEQGFEDFDIHISSDEVEELDEITFDNDDDFVEEYGILGYVDDDPLWEAEYRGRKVKLNKPMRGDVKKFKVYVKNPKGNVVKVNFGSKKMRIKKSNPARRRSFRARHNCDNPGPKHKARYWSCRKW